MTAEKQSRGTSADREVMDAFLQQMLQNLERIAAAFEKVAARLEAALSVSEAPHAESPERKAAYDASSGSSTGQVPSFGIPSASEGDGLPAASMDNPLRRNEPYWETSVQRDVQAPGANVELPAPQVVSGTGDPATDAPRTGVGQSWGPTRLSSIPGTVGSMAGDSENGAVPFGSRAIMDSPVTAGNAMRGGPGPADAGWPESGSTEPPSPWGLSARLPPWSVPLPSSAAWPPSAGLGQLQGAADDSALRSNQTEQLKVARDQLAEQKKTNQFLEKNIAGQPDTFGP